MSKLKNLNLLATVALILGACAPAATPAPVVVLPTQGPKPTVAVVIVPSNTPKPTPVPALPVEIVYWDHFDASIQKEALAQTEAYNGLQTAVKVLEQGFPAEFSLPVWVDPKTGPDIASLGTGQVWDLSSQGALVALDTLPGFKEATSNIPADILKSLTADDGHVYAIPYVGSAVMMAYNKKLFAEAGISAPPATWSEALVACKKLSNKAKGQFGWTFGNWGLYGGDWWMPLFHFDDYYMNAAGDRAWVTKTGDVHLTDTPAAKITLEFFKAIGDAGCTPRATDLDFPALFKQGKVGMADMLPVLAGGLDEAEYGLAPLPVPDSMVGTHANSDAGFGTFAIFARSEHPTETFDFLTWLVKDPDRAVERIVGTSRLPVRTDVETNEKIQAALAGDWVVKSFAAEVPFGRGNIPLSNQQAVYLALSKEIQAVMTGVKTVDQALIDAEVAIKAEFP